MRAIIGACVCAGAFALTAGPALADAGHPNYPDSSLALSTSAPQQSGYTFTLNVTGSNAEVDDALGDPTDYDLILFIVDPTQQPTCEATEDDELNDSIDDPDAVEIFSIDGEPTVNEGVSGPFSEPVQVQINPSFSGPLMFCAYSLWDDFDDAASASVSLNVTATGPAPPTGTNPPPTAPAPAPTPLPPTAPQKKLPLKRPKGKKRPKAIIPKPNKVTKPKVVTPPQVIPAGKNEVACFTGTWLQLPTKYAFTWRMPHRRGALGHKFTLKLTGAERGRKVQCAVTVSNSAGRKTAVSPAFKIK